MESLESSPKRMGPAFGCRGDGLRDRCRTQLRHGVRRRAAPSSCRYPFASSNRSEHRKTGAPTSGWFRRRWWPVRELPLHGGCRGRACSCDRGRALDARCRRRARRPRGSRGFDRRLGVDSTARKGHLSFGERPVRARRGLFRHPQSGRSSEFGTDHGSLHQRRDRDRLFGGARCPVGGKVREVGCADGSLRCARRPRTAGRSGDDRDSDDAWYFVDRSGRRRRYRRSHSSVDLTWTRRNPRAGRHSRVGLYRERPHDRSLVVSAVERYWARVLEFGDEPRLLLLIAVGGVLEQSLTATALWLALGGSETTAVLVPILVVVPLPQVASVVPIPGSLGAYDLLLAGALALVTGGATVPATAAVLVVRTVALPFGALAGGVCATHLRGWRPGGRA